MRGSCIATIPVHEFPDLALLPLLAEEWHPAVGGEAVREETDAPAEGRPERPVDRGGGNEIDDVQEDIDRDEGSDVDIERPDSAGATACLRVAIRLVVRYCRR